MNKNIAKHAKAKHALTCERTKEHVSERAGTRVGKAQAKPHAKASTKPLVVVLLASRAWRSRMRNVRVRRSTRRARNGRRQCLPQRR